VEQYFASLRELAPGTEPPSDLWELIELARRAGRRRSSDPRHLVPPPHSFTTSGFCVTDRICNGAGTPEVVVIEHSVYLRGLAKKKTPERQGSGTRTFSNRQEALRLEGSLLKERDRDRRVIDRVLSDYKNRKLVLRIADYCNRRHGACGIAL
jgi:hypothetical protein